MTSGADPRPVLLVTNHVAPERVPAFAALHRAEGVEVALWAGRLRHGVAPATRADSLFFPTQSTSQHRLYALASSRRFRAVICGTGGRMGLPAAYVGARRAGVPFVLWASLWAQPRSLPGAAGYPILRWIYAHADAVASYGAHVSAYVRARGARRVVEAPQAVDNGFWSARAEPERRAGFQVLFAGRLEAEKGVEVLLDAWARVDPDLADERLVLAGRGPAAARAGQQPAVEAVGPLAPAELRNFYAGSDVVVLPSLRTATFREPWGLVVNEAFNQHVPVIASDQVGAAAGGLVVDGATGLVVAAGDPGRLAAALRRLRDDRALGRRLGNGGAAAVSSQTPEAWAAGMRQALALVGVSRSPDR